VLRTATGTLLIVVGLSIAAGGCGNAGETGSSGNAPKGPITLVNPYPPGGVTDIASRIIAPALEKELGTPVRIENAPGGSGAVGLNRVLQSKPDGQTIGIVTLANGVVTPLLGQAGYAKDDFSTIGLVDLAPSVLAVREDSPYKDARAFFAAAKQRPSTLRVATNGALTDQQLGIQRLAQAEDLKLRLVPFEGSAPAFTALLGKNVDAISVNTDVAPRVEQGEFRAIAIASAKKSAFLPKTATYEEQGFDYPGSAFIGLGGPKALPPNVRNELERGLLAALKDPTVVEKFKKAFTELDPKPGKELKALIDDRSKQLAPILEQVKEK